MSQKIKKTTRKQNNFRTGIKSVEETSDCLSSRAGLAPVVNFLKGTGLAGSLAETFADFRANSKGIGLEEVFFQILINFIDGSEKGLVAFDKHRADDSWKKLVGDKNILNTAQVKRILAKCTGLDQAKLREYVRKSFLSLLKAQNPSEVVLFLDSSVYDNDGAKCRTGVNCTYKKKEGFHPINLIWDGIYLDSVFQAGNCSTNHDNVVVSMLEKIVPEIRKTLGEKTKIIIRMDSGYFDQKIFAACDELKIHFVCAGKRYSDHKELENKNLEDFENKFQGKGCVWKFCSFEERRATWPEEMKYRALFLRATEIDGEALLGLDSRIILTNLSEDDATNEQIIRYDHSRGADELTHRAVKEFHSERMPCLDFDANAFWYQLSILAFNLYQIYKRKIACFTWNAYPNTFRRRFVDIAGKIVCTARQYILKVTKWTMKELEFEELWRRSLIPWLI